MSQLSCATSRQNQGTGSRPACRCRQIHMISSDLLYKPVQRASVTLACSNMYRHVVCWDLT